jgi:YVTN family beta-propeller protein
MFSMSRSLALQSRADALGISGTTARLWRARLQIITASERDWATGSFGLLVAAWAAGFLGPLPGDGLAQGVGDPLQEQRVGPAGKNVIVPTGQLIRPAGQSVAFGGRPVDIALSPDQHTVFVKNTDSLLVLDAAQWQVLQELAYPKGEAGSMHGLAVSQDGGAVYVTGSVKNLLEARRDNGGPWKWHRQIQLGSQKVNPCGVALAADGHSAYAGLSISNTLAVIDLDASNVSAEIPTGVCPFDVVLARDGQTAYVSNFGGRHARPGEHSEESVGTPVVVDDRSIARTGTITRIDLQARQATGELAVGLHPAELVLSPDGSRLLVANANSDSVSVIETGSFQVRETISVRPDPQLPFGSLSNALTLSTDGRTLFVANGGNNAIAVVALATQPNRPSAVRGFIPAGWFPGGVCTDGTSLYIANVKGEGSRDGRPGTASWNSKQVRGSVTRVAIPAADQLAGYTQQVAADARVPQILRALEQAHSGLQPVPVPQRPGEPSTIEHVVYVIKENRTYDQVFGDMPQGNNDPKLCIYGRQITPNHHALADEFVLLDNYYCNGVVSADGHQWATQGAVTDYQEKSFGGHVRSYDFGTDALAYAGCNFLWDSVLLHGRTFRNYGEFDFPSLVPDNANWFDVYNDFRNQAGQITFRQVVPMETLHKYTSPIFPGWNLAIPDALRLEAFLKEFQEYEQRGEWQNLVIVYLPQDHTAGTGRGHPTPRACLADNDLALGRLVEAISHSRFWARTAIFVNEDDPQDGWDHVDGHRSICLVVSPYVKRHALVSQFYNQLSVLHTIERILGLPSTAQMTAQAPTMEACFTGTPDLTPYTALPPTIPLDERNEQASAPDDHAWELVRASEAMDFSRPDRIDEDTFNRILWHASMGREVPYPAALAGAHGNGLRSLKLQPLVVGTAHPTLNRQPARGTGTEH